MDNLPSPFLQNFNFQNSLRTRGYWTYKWPWKWHSNISSNPPKEKETRFASDTGSAINYEHFRICVYQIDGIPWIFLNIVYYIYVVYISIISPYFYETTHSYEYVSITISISYYQHASYCCLSIHWYHWSCIVILITSFEHSLYTVGWLFYCTYFVDFASVTLGTKYFFTVQESIVIRIY